MNEYTTFLIITGIVVSFLSIIGGTDSEGNSRKLYGIPIIGIEITIFLAMLAIDATLPHFYYGIILAVAIIFILFVVITSIRNKELPPLQLVVLGIIFVLLYIYITDWITG